MKNLLKGFEMYDNMKNIIILILFLIFIPFSAHGKTVFLKNGMKMNAEKVWEKNGEIKCFINGLVVSFPKNEIKKITDENIVKSKTMSVSGPTSEITVYDMDTAKKYLLIKSEKLDKEYKKLMIENKQLTNEKKYLKSDNKRIIRYNENVKRYEQNKTAYEAEVKAFGRWMEKTSVKTTVNEETFSSMARSWIGRNIKAFIDQWGYPNKIIKNPAKNDRYIFNVNISSSNIVTISFTADPTGKIIDSKTKKELRVRSQLE